MWQETSEEAMKRPLCITTFVFGHYEEYIPLFVYSILRAYPDYYPLIFTQGPLGESVRQRLNLLCDLGRFRVQENYLGALRWRSYKGSAVRWLLYDGEFADCEAVYAGDVDMLVMPETPKLHEQHNIHCEVLGLPYSNILRPPRVTHVRKDPVGIARRLTRFGPKNTFRALAQSEIRLERLSGLHYVRTDEYYRAVLPKMLEFMGLLGAGRGITVLPADKYLNGFSDEAFLFDLIRESGLDLPPEVDYGPHLLEYRNYRSVGFRPHHGIHLAIFRTANLNTAYRATLLLDCYREYYTRYMQEMKQEPLFQALLKSSPAWLQAMFARIESSYEAVAATQ
jgi:hypothetical protein